MKLKFIIILVIIWNDLNTQRNISSNEQYLKIDLWSMIITWDVQ